VDARFAGGSMVRFFLGHTNIHVVNVCVTKIGFLPPHRQRYPPPYGGLPDLRRHWSFHGVRSCRGVRGPKRTAELLSVTGLPRCAFKWDTNSCGRRFRRRQHGTFVIFFAKHLYCMQMFCEKEWNVLFRLRKHGVFYLFP